MIHVCFLCNLHFRDNVVFLYILTLVIFIYLFFRLSGDVNYCNFLNFILTLIVFIVNTPESV